MKIVIDNALELTRGDYAGNLSRGVEPDIKVELDPDAEVTHTPADLFRKYGFDAIEAERPEDIGTADRQYHDLRDRLLSDEELKKQVDQKFLIALRHGYADFDRLLLQKVTYKLDPGEDIDKVAETLRNMDSNALFRAFSIDKESNTVTTYATREGIWDIDGQLTAKSAELRSAGKIRTDRAYRSVKDPTKKIDMKRANYPLLEETKALIESGAIKNSYATREQPDGSFRDDSPAVYVTALHFKETLDESDLKDKEIREKAAENVKQETTHINKPQATKEQAKESIEENSKEIHTKHEPVEVAKEKEVAPEVKETREDVLQSYVDKLFSELEERQRREREELKQKATAAMGQERIKAKQTFVTSLANGMTVTEAIDNLRAAKHNDILVQATLEEVKADMIASVKKDEIIAEKSEALEQTTKELERATKALEQTEKANKTNHENYIKELNNRKEAEIAIGKLKGLTDKLHASLNDFKSQVIDLKEENTQKDREIEEQAKELEEQFAKIEEQSNEIEELKKQVQQSEIALAKMEARMQAVEEFAEKMELMNKSFSEKIEQLTAENRVIEKEIKEGSTKKRSLSEKIKDLKIGEVEDTKKHSDDLFDQE